MECENSIFSNIRSAQQWPTLSHVVQHTLHEPYMSNNRKISPNYPIRWRGSELYWAFTLCPSISMSISLHPALCPGKPSYGDHSQTSLFHWLLVWSGSNWQIGGWREWARDIHSSDSLPVKLPSFPSAPQLPSPAFWWSFSPLVL